MRYKFEKIGCYILIIVLLPYIVTVFLNGPLIVSSTNVENTKITVASGEDKAGEVRQMSFDEYGIGVLACEVPADYETEAIKAQAILVRTKLYKCIEENGSDCIFTEKFWTRDQMEKAWGITKFTSNYNKIESAWHQTKGQVLLYEGKLIYTPFFRLSNGSTRDGKEVLGEDYSYLKIKDCPLDIENVEQIQTKVLENIDAEKTKIEVLSCDTAGYVLKVRVGEEEVSGEEFRKNYNLASGCFSVQEYEGKVRITTRGVGHGIGLSQNTANKMAENGKEYGEILKYFYEGCELKEVADFVNSTEISDKAE